MEFPHLADTEFPILNNVNVYAYRNVFDYTRWFVNTKVHLTNVLWNSDYNDVVKFDTDSDRDEWFDSQSDNYEITLTTNVQLPPEGGIKLPIPFDVASRYNYLYVDIPVMTDSSNPIEYEDSDARIGRWYFFVNEVSSRAPNTTMFIIALDVWTQFQNDIDIKYLFLERGHAPVAATDTDEYLANPISNNDYLLTPDVTPTNAGIVRNATYIPFGNGTKYVCFATAIGQGQLSSMGAVTHNDDSHDFTDFEYTDVEGERSGYQAQVSGGGVGTGDNYQSAKTPATIMECSGSRHRTLNDLTIYAVPASDAHGTDSGTDAYHAVGSFFYDVLKMYPQFIRSIQGLFIVDENMFEIVSTHTLAGHTFYRVRGKAESYDFPTLTKSDFAYPSRYQRFAKLYTYPYAELELTDNDGEVVNVRIENTGDIRYRMITSLAFPFLLNRIYFTGINGVGSQSYTWRLLNGSASEQTMPFGDWFECCFDSEIPVYALYMDAETIWMLDNYSEQIGWGMVQEKANYRIAARAANNEMENIIDLDATVHTNAVNANATNYTNTVNQDAAVYNNAVDSNTTMYNNADADATTLTTNTANTVSTTASNVAATIATNTAKTTDANNTSVLCNVAIDGKLNAVNTAANASTVYISGATNEALATTTKNNGAGGVAGSAATALVAGSAYGVAVGAAGGSVVPAVGTLAGALGGAAVGGVAGLISSAASWGTADANASVAIATNQVVTQQTVYWNNYSYQETSNCNSDVTTLQNTLRTNNTNADNTLLDANTTRSNNNLTRNNGNTATTMRNNANRSRNTGNSNALRTQTTGDANAARTQTTGDANALRTQSTNDSNARYDRNMRINNAKRTLEAARYDTQGRLYDARRGRPVQVGSYAGNPTADYMLTRGVQVKVKTMPDAEVRQVGDWFARYGYALEQVWDVAESGLCPMNHFCYWKCRDAWVDDRKSSNNAAQTLITAMFERGVTVWNNPDEVGRVSIYDN